ncbi:hypothetical protein Hc94105_0866 [Helicobacter cinaedi]|nr:hypothetical protein Hc94105_0866 [Helicobacter cinaedi]
MKLESLRFSFVKRQVAKEWLVSAVKSEIV